MEKPLFAAFEERRGVGVAMGGAIAALFCVVCGERSGGDGAAAVESRGEAGIGGQHF
jgi:hypothetical protein